MKTTNAQISTLRFKSFNKDSTTMSRQIPGCDSATADSLEATSTDVSRDMTGELEKDVGKAV